MDTGALTLTDSGRSALRLALRALQLNFGAKVLVPAYICSTVIEAIEAEGCEALLHPVNDDLTLSGTLPEPLPNAAVLVGYFGFAPSIQLAELLSAAHVPIIFDLTHSWLSQAVVTGVCNLAMRHGHLIMASLRKILPLPDGGMVWAPQGAPVLLAQPTELAPHSHLRMTAMLAKSAQLREGTQTVQNTLLGDTALWPRNGPYGYPYQQAFLAAEEALNCQDSIYTISKCACRLLQLLNLAHIIDTRRRNYNTLLAQSVHWAGKATQLYTTLPAGFCPLGMPVLTGSLVQRDNLLRYLAHHGVQPLVHWPLGRAAAQQFSIARGLSMHMVTIPCDQRYSERDMTALGECISQWCRRPRLQNR